MKQIFSLFCLVFLLLSACAKTPETPAPIEEPKPQLQQQQPATEPILEPQPPTWEEQYDLGLRYLSEGKYEEAIIAFTAAIEIDPKRAPAFVGRGDTYVELAKPETNLPSYDSAERDYQAALELDDQAVEVYVKLSEVYFAIDEPIKAVEILQQGYDITGDESLKERIETLQKELASGTFVGIPIDDSLTYGSPRTYNGYPVGAYAGYGIRFPTPVSVIVTDTYGKSIEVEISEAELQGPMEEFIEKLVMREGGVPGPLIGKTVEITGHFTFEDRDEFVFWDEKGVYCYEPNGPYIFWLETMNEINLDTPYNEYVDKTE